MAIQPIDLQTLFTQVDKVGKSQIAQRDGLVVQQAIQGAHLQRKTEEHIQEVNEAQNTGDGAEKINDRGQRRESASGRGKKGSGGDDSGEDAENGEQRPAVFQDPCLGKNIDISL